MRVWKRNAVVGTVVLFVCVALYLSWSYNRVPEEAEVFDPAGAEKIQENGIGGTTLVDDQTLEEANAVTGAGSGETQNTQLQNDYFFEARLSRQQARDSALSILKEAADRESTTQEIRDKASHEIENLAQNVMSEARIESLVVAKGYVDCVAYKSADGINVVVSASEEGLTASDVSKIKDIVVAETKLTAENIKIVEVKA